MKKLFALIVAAAFALPAGLSVADDDPVTPPKPKTRAEIFKRLDTNEDGKLSLEEFIAKKPNKEQAERRFRRLDLNGDGFLDLEEFKNGQE